MQQSLLQRDVAPFASNFAAGIKKLPDWVDVVIALAVLFILAAIPQTSKIAVWIALAILFLQLTVRRTL